MMRILLISDTHMYNEKMDHILEHEKYDIVIHCGDISVDEDDPHLKKMLVVQGNHDQSFLPITIKKNIDGYHCLITHGQKFDVYRGYDKLSQYKYVFTVIPMFPHIFTKIIKYLLILEVS